MNTKQKKALYESIMKNISKTIKKQLNENAYKCEDAEDSAYKLFDMLQDNPDALVYMQTILHVLYHKLDELEYCKNRECIQDIMDDYTHCYEHVIKLLQGQ